MLKSLAVRLGTVATALVTVIGLSTPSVAAPPVLSTAETVLEAGLACAGFDLQIEITNYTTRPEPKNFEDKNGNVVRTLDVGFGDKLVFTNLSTDKTLSLRPNGSGSITRIGADGTTTVSTMGHNVVVLFPTDVPAGPSTILYVGRLVYTVDANGVFTVQTFSGTTLDICAALA